MKDAVRRNLHRQKTQMVEEKKRRGSYRAIVSDLNKK